MPHPLVKEILYTKEQIAVRAKELGTEISVYYQGQKVKDETVLLIGLLKGSIPFMGELMMSFDFECETDYMVVSSYQGGLKTNGDPKIVLDVNSDLKNRHILIIEDVIDSGSTLDFITHYFYSRGAQEVKIVTLINKKVKREVDLKVDWSGFQITDHFIIGYGLDYQERLRNLPYVAICDVDKLSDWKW